MKKLISALLVPCLLLQFFSCHSMQPISRESLSYKNEAPHLIVLTSDNRQIEFQVDTYTIISDTLQGEGTELARKKDTQSKPFNGKIPLSDIKQSSTERFDIGGTIIITGIIAALLVLGLTYDPIKDN